MIIFAKKMTVRNRQFLNAIATIKRSFFPQEAILMSAAYFSCEILR